MVKPKTDPNYLSSIRQMLIDRFDLEELRDLCFSLGIDYAVFPQWRAGMARELVVYLVRAKALPALISKIQETRLDIDVVSYLKTNNRPRNTKSTTIVNKIDPDDITEAWTLELSNSPSNQPIIFGQVCLIPLEAEDADGSIIQAVTLSKGYTVWELRFDDLTVSGFVKVNDDLVLVSLSVIDPYDGEGMLLALDSRGREKWRYLPGAQYLSPVAVAQSVHSMALHHAPTRRLSQFIKDTQGVL